MLSRYFHDIVNPILYRRLIFDPNHYSTYTLSLLKRNHELAHRITNLTLLSPIFRDIPTCLRVESEELYRTLEIPYAPIPSDAQLVRYWSPAGMPQLSDLDEEVCTRPILHLFPSFTGLTTLRIVKDCLPCDFLHWISELPRLTDLEIQDSMISEDFQPKYSPTPFPLRTLSILRCWTRAEIFENYIPGKICEGLLRNAPFLTSLTVDLFVERAACHVLSEMDPPPPIHTLSCHGLGPHDPDCALFCSVLSNLPTITTLNMTRTPRELGPVLPKESLRQLRNLTGQIRSLGIFFGVNRPLEYLTIVDSPVANGRASWESQLIFFFESVKRYGTKLKGLAFNVSEWSEEVFLCVCKLWPGLRELRIQCTTGPGVDEVCLLLIRTWRTQLIANSTSVSPSVLDIFRSSENWKCCIYTRRPFNMGPSGAAWQKECLLLLATHSLFPPTRRRSSRKHRFTIADGKRSALR